MQPTMNDRRHSKPSMLNDWRKFTKFAKDEKEKQNQFITPILKLEMTCIKKTVSAKLLHLFMLKTFHKVSNFTCTPYNMLFCCLKLSLSPFHCSAQKKKNDWKKSQPSKLVLVQFLCSFFFVLFSAFAVAIEYVEHVLEEMLFDYNRQ